MEQKIIISNHAEERLCERLSKNKQKFEKITAKAWRSRAPLPRKCRVHKNNDNIYRFFCGYVFAFAVENRRNSMRIILVTVFDHRDTRQIYDNRPINLYLFTKAQHKAFHNLKRKPKLRSNILR